MKYLVITILGLTGFLGGTVGHENNRSVQTMPVLEQQVGEVGTTASPSADWIFCTLPYMKCDTTPRDRIITCESHWQIDAYNQSGAYGLAQFKEKTFDWLAQKANFNGEWKNPDDQIKLLDWAIENNYSYLWECKI